MSESVNKSEKHWAQILDEDAFMVCRKKGTEPPFSGKYVNTKIPGIYHCVCCGSPLFSSSDKYDSGTGWPSFKDEIPESTIAVSHSFVTN